MKAKYIQLYILVFVCGVVLGALVYGGYKIYELQRNASVLGERILFSEKILQETSKKLAGVALERDIFEQNYYAEKKRMDDLIAEVGAIQSMVGVLEKLQKTDPELLKKYSKVYFLNENYVPEALTPVDSRYVYEPQKSLLMYDKVWPYMRGLLEDAEKEGVDIKIISAFRSFGEQAILKSGYSVVYGTGANQFSADQGYSEHQLGTAVDFAAGPTGADFNAFGKTPAYAWLVGHAHTYGFILSYPEGNAYYRSEPWHWRFVGRNLAEKLHAEDKYFYDLDQRVLDTYLISLFD